MALSRVTVWTAGQVLTAADLNGEFNNVLSNPIALISPTTGDINYASNQAILFRLENLAADPATVAAGRIWFQTAKDQPQVDDGTVIRTIPALISTDITQGDLIVSASSGSGAFKPITIGNAGQALVVTSSGGQIGWGTPAASGGGGYSVRNLTGGVTSSQAASFSFEYAQLRSTAGTATFQMNATSSWLVNVGTVGVGGRDQAGVFASTYVNVYVVSTGANSTTPIGLCSSVFPPTGPTLPSSCTAWAFVGTFLYSSASTGWAGPIEQRGNKIIYSEVTTSNGQVIVTSSATSTAGGGRTVTYSGVVPPNATEYDLSYEMYGAASGEPNFIHLVSTNDPPYWKSDANLAAGYSNNLVIPMPNQASGTFKTYITTTPRTVRAAVIRYKVSNGDN